MYLEFQNLRQVWISTKRKVQNAHAYGVGFSRVFGRKRMSKAYEIQIQKIGSTLFLCAYENNGGTTESLHRTIVGKMFNYKIEKNEKNFYNFPHSVCSKQRVGL